MFVDKKQLDLKDPLCSDNTIKSYMITVHGTFLIP